MKPFLIFGTCLALAALLASGCQRGEIRSIPEESEEEEMYSSKENRETTLSEPETGKQQSTAVLVIRTSDRVFYATLESNRSAQALVEKLNAEALTLVMSDYGHFEKVGTLPWVLPESNEDITTGPGDVILYQGDKLTLYYDTNRWNFTKVAHIGNATKEALLEALGEGDAVVTFSLEWSE